MINLETKPHVDDFIDDSLGTLNDKNAQYARWMFNHFRLPASLRYDFDKFMKDYKLFCTYKNKKYRVTGASRLGDVWLNKDFTADHGYNLRVSVDQCSEWSDS